MKVPDAHPFAFSEDQLKALKLCWKRPGDSSKAGAYLAAIAPRIRDWLAAPPQGPTHREIRSACKEFADRLAKIRTFMDEEQEKLYALIHCQDDFTEAEIRSAAAAFRQSADTLTRAAKGAERSIDVGSGPDTSHEQLLVAQLAELWRWTFRREPSSGPDSNFRALIRELKAILGKQYKFGPETIKAGIADRGVFVPPADFVFICKDDPL